MTRTIIAGGRDKIERIVGVAIRWEGETFYMCEPARHHDIIEFMATLGYGPEATRDQGFRTTSGRFVDRKEALEIAKAARQIEHKTPPEDELFSEDLW